jgi:hypothetical protein
MLYWATLQIYWLPRYICDSLRTLAQTLRFWVAQYSIWIFSAC